NVIFKGESASLVKVKGAKTLLVSAYLEHRTAVKEVRKFIRCFNFSHLLTLETHSENDTSVIKLNKDFFGYLYGTADIMCPLPPGCETPVHVAITLNGSKSEGTRCAKRNETKLFPYNFTVCFSVMFDFTNVLQLVQSLEMLQLLGVNKAVIYKTSCSQETQRVLDYYASKGFVEVVPWSLSKYLNVSRGFMSHKDPGDIHYFGQMPALSDCLYRYMYQSRYMAFQDPDELILPQSKRYGANKCYMFENNVFPRERSLPPPKPQVLPKQNQWQNVAGVNILAHLYKEPIMPQFKWAKFKIIVNPRAVFTITVHGVVKSQKGCAWIDRNIARMYHTR
uniref:Glycosyltransferase family 92 protein n=1 Tax=Cyprinodon variegatus TaxID=28743 RepID=A0A3Q2D410_CYPVA